LVLASACAWGQSAAFTYQGRLDDGGQPANGVHDVRFTLFDAGTGGTQVGTTQCVENLQVVDGVVAVNLNFGNPFITTSDRYLEIAVRRDTGLDCANTAGFTTLTPRQPLTAAPLATHAASAFRMDAADGSPAGAVMVDAGGNVGIGTTTPLAKLHVDSGDLVLGHPSSGWLLHARSHAFGDFFQLTDTVGVTPQFQRGLVLNKQGNIGVGTTAPGARLDVRGDIRLGGSGQYQAPAGEERLRLIRGVVAANGTIIAGAGFSVARTSIGMYVITFTTSFAGPPAVTAVTEYGGVTAAFVMTDGVTESSATLRVRSKFDGEGDRDDPFHFIAVGPR
jgi:hypothetical protein